jgi:Kdo2-lipid IVA lauroyltransferase/acyltransferase
MNKNSIEFFFFSLITKLLQAIGLGPTRKLGKFIGSVIYYLIPIRKKVVLQNLTRALPSKPISEIKTIALKNFQSISITFCEFFYLPYASKEEMKASMDVTITDECKKIIEAKNGFLFLTGHFGSWELAGQTFSLFFSEHDYCMLAQPQRNPYVTKHSTAAREVFGTKVIFVGVSVRNMIKALKNGDGVLIAGDQRGPVDSPRINFMGVPTSYHMGTATIIAKTKSQVMVGFAIRQAGYKYKITIEKLDLENLPENLTEQIIEIQTRYIKILEKYVKQFPEQYFWMHKIWKY